MKIRIIAQLAIAASLSLALTGCQSVTYEQFKQNPKSISKAQLCRTLMETQDVMLAQLVIAELSRRGISYTVCPAMVQQQNQAAATVAAVALTGAAVAVCADGSCAPRNYPSYSNYQGACQHTWQRDAAGRLCGKRAADYRPGGR